jgi:hydrophobic/amphiphilic exporter-1 (mainly G- bacteria), HAE1 family
MQWLASISVRRPVFATVIIVAMCVVGLVGYRSLGVDKFPKVDFPIITITTFYPGAAPTSVESDVTKHIESAVNTVSGLDTLTSISTEGVSLVIAQFVLEKDADQATQEIEQRITAVLRDLPETVTKPETRKADPDAAPIAVLSVRGNQPIRDVTDIADKVKQRMERLSGVGQVTLLGGQKRQINVTVDPIKMNAAGVTVAEVFRAVSVGQLNAPAGRFEQGATNMVMRIETRSDDAAGIADNVVRQKGDHPVLVGDVATVTDTVEDAETAALRDGVATVALAVRKQSGTNTISTVDSILAEMAAARAALPPGYSLDLVRDNSEQIRTSVSLVLEHLVLGSLLAAIVVLVFLGSLRSTVIAAVSIPVSIIATFGLIQMAGFTLNLMTLLALALAVGIVIDDSIVVLENIFRFIHVKKMRPFPAAIHATKEIGFAVLATTLSLLAVFLPVAFMSGIVGRFLMSFGLTMAFAIAVSLIVAFTLTPMMAARMLPMPDLDGEPRKSWLEKLVDHGYRPIERTYVRMLAWSLSHRWVIVLACIGSCATVPMVAGKVGGGFLPANDEAQFEIYVRTPENSTLEYTTVYTERLARRTREIPEVKSTLVTVADGDQRQANVAKVYVRLLDPGDRAKSQDEVMDEVRNKVLVDIPPGTSVAAQLVNDFSVGGQNAVIAFVISGPDLEKLEGYGRKALSEVAKIPGVVDLDSSLRTPVEEVSLTPSKAKASRSGVDLGDVASTLPLLIGGAEAATFEDNGEQYRVFVRAEERFRDDPAALSLLSVPSRTFGQVPLSDVVETHEVQSASQVTRMSRERAVTITCNITPGFSESEIMANFTAILTALDMPPGYKFEPFGRSKESAKLAGAFLFAILLAFVFMYLVLAAQFESLLHPLTIMLALPLTLPFAMVSLLLFGEQMNIFSMLGLLVLFGVVKKNAILQVDHTNHLRSQGMPRTEAVLAANRDRLRPILMTTFAFVAGLLPLVWSHGIGSGFSRSMAASVVGGQTLSLLLTLLAIPVIYTLFDDLSLKVNRRVRRLFHGNNPPPDRGEAEVGLAVSETPGDVPTAAIH